MKAYYLHGSTLEAEQTTDMLKQGQRQHCTAANHSLLVIAAEAHRIPKSEAREAAGCPSLELPSKPAGLC